jgi:hypothetical protein
MIMNVAVFLLKHSPRFGQSALWHTVFKPRDATKFFVAYKLPVEGKRFFNQEGSRLTTDSSPFPTEAF